MRVAAPRPALASRPLAPHAPRPPPCARRRAVPAAAADAAADAPSFSVVRVRGDGSCLFRALAQGASILEGRGKMSEAELRPAGFALRRAICDHIAAHPADFEPFLTAPLRVYLLSMMVEGTWGGEIELAAAPAVVRRPVCVYRREGGGDPDAGGPLSLARWVGGGGRLVKVSEYGVDDHEGVPPVCLLYEGRVHYDLLVVKE